MNYVNDDVMINLLVNEFPAVPARILAAVLASYLPVTNSATEAIIATRYRVADACAI